MLREFRVGYAPSAWDRVLVGAQRDGFGPPELVAAGLAQRGRESGGLYDRFRGPDHVPAGAMRADGCSASARGRWRKGAGRST